MTLSDMELYEAALQGAVNRMNTLKAICIELQADIKRLREEENNENKKE